MPKETLHVTREAGEGLVEIVHLSQDADSCQNHKDVGRRVAELIVAGKGELEGNAKSLDGHDGDGADGRANGEVNEGVLLPVDRGDLVNHKNGKADDCNGVE